MSHDVVIGRGPGPAESLPGPDGKTPARRVAAGYEPADISSVNVEAESTVDITELAVHPRPDRAATGRSTWQSYIRGACL
ncbi:hypothetical protein [Actinoalloteichus hymeniacidonis]|uniref:Uncharacterized protein n=1 Tax=Actinoalloteichus hymeniacidonis TaxID=340345 RepID=A0AAC9MZM8_9PSEU|nr:hypothetical protein [Actinoalloteichus hymeniacidonis]AOS64126.1 hypothetical protein TL08_16630 [Actinoalloteichus hymeniacidonis]MBB5907810.1 hypothetical protein [Actinoalloteichus hymeniacidonis]